MEGGASTGRTHKGQGEKNFEGKEAGLLPPWNGKEDRRGLEQRPPKATEATRLRSPPQSRSAAGAGPGAGNHAHRVPRRPQTPKHRGRTQQAVVPAYAPSNYSPRRPPVWPVGEERSEK